MIKADSKFIFTAFCLAMRQLDKDSKSIIKLPIFLDATCSGIQHLAGLIKDFELGSRVNLIPHSDSDPVGDIYSDIMGPINNEINKFGEENIRYNNLSKVKFTRSLLKISIMTKVYNVTNYGISEQLISQLEKVSKDSMTLYKTPTKNGYINLNREEIFQIAQIINEQVFILFPSLKNIYNYLLNIARLMIKLNIPLSCLSVSFFSTKVLALPPILIDTLFVILFR